MTETKHGFGMLFKSCMRLYTKNGASKLFQLLDLCQPDFKVSTYAQLASYLKEGESLAILKAYDILEILDMENHCRALATILQNVILTQEGIDLLVVTDAADSDNIILGYDTSNPPNADVCLQNKVDDALRKYVAICFDSKFHPMFVSWEVEVQPPREFFVDTPLGKIRVWAKGDSVSEYPGVYVDLICSDNETVPLACVEYTPSENTIAVDTYCDGNSCGEECERVIVKNIPGAELVEAKKLISDFLRAEFRDRNPDFSDLSHIPLMWTEYEDDDFEVNVYADLVNYSIDTDVTPFNGKPVRVSSYKYDTLRELIDEQLELLDFSSFTSIIDSEWVEFHKDPDARKWLAEKFPVGSRVLIPATVGSGKELRGVITGQTDKGYFAVLLDDGTDCILGFGLSVFGIDCTGFTGTEVQA